MRIVQKIAMTVSVVLLCVSSVWYFMPGISELEGKLLPVFLLIGMITGGISNELAFALDKKEMVSEEELDRLYELIQSHSVKE